MAISNMDRFTTDYNVHPSEKLNKINLNKGPNRIKKEIELLDQYRLFNYYGNQAELQTWDANTVYEIDELVKYNNIVYKALTDNFNNIPEGDDVNWANLLNTMTGGAAHMSAEEILGLLTTIDGPDSGLNADLLDNLNSSDFTKYSSTGILGNALADKAWVATYGGSSNVDHVWYDDELNRWNFCADTNFKGEANAAVAAGTYVSTVATGTAPLYVVSTTKVPNLNSAMVDGKIPSISATADTIASRDSSGDITVRLVRSTYPEQSTSAAPGADICFRNNTSDNFLRFMTREATRAYLGISSNFGSVGTYCLARPATQQTIQPGAYISGSGLRASGIDLTDGSDHFVLEIGSALLGTWMHMGYLVNRSHGQMGLFLRIA